LTLSPEESDVTEEDAVTLNLETIGEDGNVVKSQKLEISITVITQSIFDGFVWTDESD
jgi:hypothetical protein